MGGAKTNRQAGVGGARTNRQAGVGGARTNWQDKTYCLCSFLQMSVLRKEGFILALSLREDPVRHGGEGLAAGRRDG